MQTEDLSATINFACHPKDTPITTLNGPGRRIALWVQGCALRCTSQCISPQLLDVRPRHVLSIAEAWDALQRRSLNDADKIEGVTFLGGEPTEQAAGLALLAAMAHQRGWTVVTYTGHTFETLQQSSHPAVSRLLEQTDILIDGPYVSRLGNPSLRWRGSSNQRIIVLSQRYSAADLLSLPICKGTDVTITADHRLVVTGMQDSTMVQRFVENLRRRGVVE